MGFGPEPKNERNWAVWREYRSGGIHLADLGAKYDITASRTRQIVTRFDKLVRHALRMPFHPTTEPLDGHVRDGILGVEFTFRADDPWDPIQGFGDWAELDDLWFQITVGASDE